MRKKKTKIKNWELRDIEAAATKNPKLIFIPSYDERHNRKIGNQVKLHFLFNDQIENLALVEKIWVEVKESLSHTGKYEGILKHTPKLKIGIKRGDKVIFEPRHIAEVLVNKGEPAWIECSELNAVVSKMVFEDDIIRYASRDEPINAKDSGWQFLSDRESDEYVREHTNIIVCNVGWLADLDPTLKPILDSKIGSIFVREDKESDWEKVTDE